MRNLENSSIKIAVIYHYFEANNNYQKNFQHFLNFGTSIPADIYCLISETCSFELPAIKNVKYFKVRNHNLDYGAFTYALNNLIDWNQYNYLTFVNCSVRGPFIPPHCDPNWLQNYLNLFEKNVGLVGCGINVLPIQSPDSVRFADHFPQYRPPYSHVQTTAYMLSQQTLQLLMNNHFYSTDRSLNKQEIILNYEILLSQLVLSSGLKIHCLLPEYNQIDFSKRHNDQNPSSYCGDPSTPNGYWGRTIHPYEGIFVKTERNLYPLYYLDLLSSSMSQRSCYQPLLFSNYSLPRIFDEKCHYELQSTTRDLIKLFRRSLKRYFGIKS